MTNFYKLPGKKTFPHTLANKVKSHYLNESQYIYHIDRWSKHSDNKSKEILILAHMPLVKRMARNLSSSNIKEFRDFCQAGYEGLLIAINKFKLSKNARFATYARWWILSSINEYKKINWSQVKIGTTEVERRLFHNFVKEKIQLSIHPEESIDDYDASIMAEKLNVKKKDVLNFDKRFKKDVYLDDLGLKNGLDDLSIDPDYEKTTSNPEKETSNNEYE